MKKIILGIFIGILLCGSVVYAVTLIDSKDVTYTPNDNSFNVSNVESALDELYVRTNSYKIALANSHQINSYTFNDDYDVVVFLAYSNGVENSSTFPSTNWSKKTNQELYNEFGITNSCFAGSDPSYYNIVVYDVKNGSRWVGPSSWSSGTVFLGLKKN